GVIDSLYYSDFYIPIDTLQDSLDEVRESFKVHVRIAGKPESEIVLEADIVDDDTAILDYERDLYTTVEYVYDFQDRLVGRKLTNHVMSETTLEGDFYDGTQIVLRMNYDDVANRYLWSDRMDQLVADEHVSWSSTAGTLYWALTDHLGTVRDLATY